MSLLAEEKHYFNPQEKLEKEMEADADKFWDIPAAKELIRSLRRRTKFTTAFRNIWTIPCCGTVLFPT